MSPEERSEERKLTLGNFDEWIEEARTNRHPSLLTLLRVKNMLNESYHQEQVTVVTHWEAGYVKVFSLDRNANVRMIHEDDPEQRFNERAEAELIERDQCLIGTEEV